MSKDDNIRPNKALVVDDDYGAETLLAEQAAVS